MLCSRKVADVFEVLRCKAKKANPVIISQRQIMEETGHSLVLISIALRKFKAGGIIRHNKSPRGSSPDSYLVNMDYIIRCRSKIITKWKCELILESDESVKEVL